MKCPNCDFIEKDEAFGQPPTCPKCGAIYEKALIARKARDQLAEKVRARKGRQRDSSVKDAETVQPATPKPGNRPSKLKRGIAGARQGIAAACAKRNTQEQRLCTEDGQPVVIKVENKSGCMRPLLLVIASIFVIAAISQQGGPSSGVSRTLSPEEEERQREISRQYRAEQVVKQGLKDPYSAKFRNQKGMCGEVNAKNSFGAYTGFKRYLVVGTDGFVDDGSRDFDDLWYQLCL